MKLRIIEDGFLLPFTAEVEGGPTLTGTYRPATPAEVDAYRVELARTKPGAERESARAEFLAAHVLSWDAEGKHGPVPPTAENLGKIPAGYADRVELHVTGYYFSPEAADHEKKSPPPPG
jgi:hypothetical protein